MKPVYYLSYSDNPEQDGLVFPSELSLDTYAPGIWAIDTKPSEKVADSYEFDAVDRNELTKLLLVRVNNVVFQVTTPKYGNFFFRIVDALSHIRYVGRSKLIEPNNLLYQIVSIDIKKLESVCSDGNFFFVGRIDRNLERRKR
jgi:hypothetical protein